MMKNDENGQLSCGIYSSPAAAQPPLQVWVGNRSISLSLGYIATEIPKVVTGLICIDE